MHKTIDAGADRLDRIRTLWAEMVRGGPGSLTLPDLRDCAEAILDGAPVDAEELQAAREMREICQTFVDAADYLDDLRECGRGCGTVVDTETSPDGVCADCSWEPIILPEDFAI